MSNSETNVHVFYGPSAWFRENVSSAAKSLIEIVTERDADRRQHTVHVEGKSPEAENLHERPFCVYAETADYSMLSEGAISGFSTLIQEISPIELLLQNPPLILVQQLRQIYGDVDESHYERKRPQIDGLREFNEKLQTELVGQEEMKGELVASLYPLTRERQRKPVVLLFFGPSGVGKTETAKLINYFCDGTLLRRQFSMFHSQKFSSYLFGGEVSEASFARDLLERDSGAILLDEFDKANPMFHSAFYQLFDDGIFEDKNYRAQVGPAVIVCTANYKSRAEVTRELGDALASRFDAMIEFKHLTGSEVAVVISKVVDEQTAMLDDDEMRFIDVEDLKEKLSSRIRQGQNIRGLTSLVKNIINMKIVSGLIN